MFKVSELAQWKKYTVLQKGCCSLKTCLFVLFNAKAESVNYSLFLKNVKTLFCRVICKKNCVKHIENLPQHLSAIIYRLPIAFKKTEIYRFLVSPNGFLTLSIIVIALVQKGLSCPSLYVQPNYLHTLIHANAKLY